MQTFISEQSSCYSIRCSVISLFIICPLHYVGGLVSHMVLVLLSDWLAPKTTKCFQAGHPSLFPTSTSHIHSTRFQPSYQSVGELIDLWGPSFSYSFPVPPPLAQNKALKLQYVLIDSLVPQHVQQASYCSLPPSPKWHRSECSFSLMHGTWLNSNCSWPSRHPLPCLPQLSPSGAGVFCWSYSPVAFQRWGFTVN